MTGRVGETLVAGVGNRLRGDDAAGLEVARLVGERAPDAVVVEHEREPSDLIALWEGARLAIVVDAVHGNEPGRIHRLEAGSEGLPAQPFHGASSHALGLGEVVELARSLDRLPERLVVLGIEGRRFDTGAPLSGEVAQAVAEAARIVLAAIGSIRGDSVHRT